MQISSVNLNFRILAIPWKETPFSSWSRNWVLSWFFFVFRLPPTGGVLFVWLFVCLDVNFSPVEAARGYFPPWCPPDQLLSYFAQLSHLLRPTPTHTLNPPRRQFLLQPSKVNSIIYLWQNQAMFCILLCVKLHGNRAWHNLSFFTSTSTFYLYLSPISNSLFPLQMQEKVLSDVQFRQKTKNKQSSGK